MTKAGTYIAIDKRLSMRNTKTSTVLSWILGVVTIAFVIFLLLMWWGSRIPKRPSNISSRSVFLERGSVPFKLSTHGDWLECWEDSTATVDRCRLADEKGAIKFEDVFLLYEGPSPVPEKDLTFDVDKTRTLHYGVKGISLPVIFLQNGQILLPQSDYEWGKKSVDYWVTHRSNTLPSR